MSQKKVLIIDDELDTCTALAERIAEAGMQTMVAHDGAEGLEKILSFKPDLVLLDMLMPVSSGLDLLRAYSTIANSDGPHFIIITNMDAMDAMNVAFAHKVTDIVAKSDMTIEGIVSLVQKRIAERVSDDLE
jgi:CheY-like chemotaxis protein